MDAVSGTRSQMTELPGSLVKRLSKIPKIDPINWFAGAHSKNPGNNCSSRVLIVRVDPTLNASARRVGEFAPSSALATVQRRI